MVAISFLPYLNCERLLAAMLRTQRDTKAATGTQEATALSELAIGSCATLTTLELPEEIQGQLMHLGFVPESRVLALRRAPAGDPTVYRVGGTEVALRRETAQSIFICNVFVAMRKDAR